MKLVKKLFAAAVVAALPLSGAAVVLKPATPSGSKQVESLGGNVVALLGISGDGATGTPYTEADFLASVLGSDQGRIVDWYFGDPILGGAWSGAPAPGSQMTFPVSIDTLSSSDKLFDSIWVEFTGTSDFNFVRPADGVGTDVISSGEIVARVGDQAFPAAPVPAPGTIGLVAVGLGGLLLLQRRRQAPV